MLYSVLGEDDEEIGSIDSGKHPLAWSDTEALFAENAEIRLIIAQTKPPMQFRLEDGKMVASREFKLK